MTEIFIPLLIDSSGSSYVQCESDSCLSYIVTYPFGIDGFDLIIRQLVIMFDILVCGRIIADRGKYFSQFLRAVAVNLS